MGIQKGRPNRPPIRSVGSHRSKRGRATLPIPLKRRLPWRKAVSMSQARFAPNQPKQYRTPIASWASGQADFTVFHSVRLHSDQHHRKVRVLSHAPDQAIKDNRRCLRRNYPQPAIKRIRQNANSTTGTAIIFRNGPKRQTTVTCSFFKRRGHGWDKRPPRII